MFVKFGAKGFTWRFLAPVVVLTACLTAVAQSPTYHLGRTPTAQEIKDWDISIGPAGKELPAGGGTAREGAKIYEQQCAQCHGKAGTEGPAVPLVGGQGTLSSLRVVRTVGSYWPFATTIWDYIRRAMPQGKEGSLSADDVYAVTAFLLHRNGIIQEADVLDAKSLPKIQMPNRNNFVPLWPDWKRKPGPFGIYP